MLKPYFWTWDHSTNWKKNEPGKQVCGANNWYTKRPEAFVDDYKRLITWSADHGIEAVGIAGLLRDSHGSVDAARQITEFAAELLGDEQAAHSWCMINRNIDENTVSAKDVDLAVEYAAGLQGEQRRRFAWLSSYAASHCWDKTPHICPTDCLEYDQLEKRR